MTSAGIGGAEQVDRIIEMMQILTESGPEFVQAGTNAALAWVQTEVAAGRDPNTGEQFLPTQKGTRPLKNAPAALSARIVGTTGLLVLSGHYIWHFFAAGYLPRRRALLQGRLPARAGDAMRLGMIPVFEAKTRRGKIGTAKYEARKTRLGV